MIYRSNLTCPDLAPHFKHLHSRVMPHSFGHDVPSDWADKPDDDPVFGIYKRCGMWTHDEAAILSWVAGYNKGAWVDIGAHTGWTTRHIAKSGAGPVYAVDPMLAVPEFSDRHIENVGFGGHALTSAAFFERYGAVSAIFDGFCIDGDHEPGEPLKDAQGAARHLAEPGVIIFHDFIGQPVREAVEWLRTQGFKDRIYFTPHMVACCWRGDFKPPDHVPDPQLVEQLQPHVSGMTNFDFSRCV